VIPIVPLLSWHLFAHAAILCTGMMSTALPAIEDGLRASTPVLWAKVEKTRREKNTKHDEAQKTPEVLKFEEATVVSLKALLL